MSTHTMDGSGSDDEGSASASVRSKDEDDVDDGKDDDGGHDASKSTGGTSMWWGRPCIRTHTPAHPVKATAAAVFTRHCFEGASHRRRLEPSYTTTCDARVPLE